MKAIVNHYVKNHIGDIEYEGGKPRISSTEVEFPIKFGYGSYNEPRKILGPYSIDVDNIISIDVII